MGLSKYQKKEGTRMNNNMKEALERIAMVAYAMGKDNVDKYEFAYKMD